MKFLKFFNARRRNRLSRRRGQGMTEYIIIVALVSIATIGAVTLFGDNIRKLFRASAEALAGNTSVANDGCSGDSNITTKTMRNFSQHNAY